MQCIDNRQLMGKNNLKHKSLITIIRFLYMQKHNGTQLFLMKFPPSQNINHEQALKN